jgi:hypothetical protein
MPTDEDQARSEMLESRLAILSEDFEDLVRAWCLEHMDEDRVDAMGPPDVSANPLADLCRQFSTPGLYGHRPKPAHGNRRNDALIGPGGHLDRAGYWTKMQQVQYLTLGLGDHYLRLDVPPDLQALTVRPVAPHNIFVRCHPDRPDQIVELWELRLRFWHDRNRWIYAWDQYDLGEQRRGKAETWVRPPSYRVLAAKKDDGDVSNVFLGVVGGYAGMGDHETAYPYVSPATGRPLLPWVRHTSRDTGRAHNHLEKRGTARGTLNAALYWTYGGHAAKSASGKAVVLENLQLAGASVVAQNGSTATVQTITIMPGAFVSAVPIEPGSPTNVREVGPGGELDTLLRWCSQYEMHQAVRWGLSPSDALKQSANPTSGAALFISNQGKREFSRQVEEVFRRSDLEAIRVAAALLTRAGLGSFDEDGYTIGYHEIPRSPEELREERDEIDWQMEHDFITPEAAYQRKNPGASDEDAHRAVMSARLGKMRLEAELKKAAEAEGLVAPEKTSLLVGQIDAGKAVVAEVGEGKYTAAQGRAILVRLVGLSEEAAAELCPDPEPLPAEPADEHRGETPPDPEKPPEDGPPPPEKTPEK